MIIKKVLPGGKFYQRMGEGVANASSSAWKNKKKEQHKKVRRESTMGGDSTKQKKGKEKL